MPGPVQLGAALGRWLGLNPPGWGGCLARMVEEPLLAEQCLCRHEEMLTLANQSALPANMCLWIH